MINLSFSCDDNFIPQLLVSLNSLLYNNSNLTFNIYILDNFISEDNKTRISKLIEKYDVYLTFIPMANFNEDIEKYVDLTSIGNLSLSAYSRLFLPLLIRDIDKILYLDCDSLIIGSIKELWETNIDNYMCAAVLDFMPVTYKSIIGLNEEDNYINTGVLLINLKMWRKQHIERDFIDFLEKHSNQFIHHDQGVINGVLKDNILILPPKYNWITSLHGRNPSKIIKWFINPAFFYNEEILHESSNNPIFLHFCNGFGRRPWINSNHFYYDLYKHYVSLAGVNDEIYSSVENQSFMTSIFALLSSNKFILNVLDLVPDFVARSITNFILRYRLKKSKYKFR